MKKAIRRMQAAFLAVLMLLSSVPAALAAETEPELPEYTAQLYKGTYDENNPEQNKVVSGMELSKDAELYYVIGKEYMVNPDAPSPSDVQGCAGGGDLPYHPAGAAGLPDDAVPRDRGGI